MNGKHAIRHDPLRDLATIRDEMERVFREGFGTARELVTTAGGWSPEVDIEETDDNYELHVELPGVKPDDIAVDVEGDLLTVSGERRFYEEKEEEGFHRIERRFGAFRRVVRLPGELDPDLVVARYSDGVLTVTVPKAAETRPYRVQIETE
jgi:HSP20 family protein